MVLVIGESLILSDIENLYQALPNKITELDIQIPYSFTGLGFAGKAAFCQFINTWVRNSSDTSSILAKLDDTDDSINNFIDDFGLYLSLMTAKQGRRILDYSKKHDFTQKVLKIAVGRLNESMPRIIGKTNEKTFIGKAGALKILCFDHSINKKIKFNEWFYQDGELLNEAVIEKFFNAAMKHVLRNQKKNLLNNVLDRQLTVLITGIIKELFENTHIHARTGVGLKANVPLNPNARGVFIELHRGNREYFNKRVESGDPLFNYFNNPKIFSGSDYDKTFLEISMIDSGPGFAQRRSNKSLEALSTYAERDFVFSCFSEINRTIGMRGLKRMDYYLSERKGFFRLRTGRLCLYRNFLMQNYEPTDYMFQQSEIIAAKKKYLDWEKDDRDITALYPASGSLITVFFPLD